MKKIISFLLAGALFIITAAVLNANIEAKLEETADISGKNLNYIGGLDKINQPELLGQIIDEDTVVMLGSSELPYYDEVSHPMIVTNYGHSDFNIMQIGVGHIQSLAHAINVGGLDQYIENRKVVLNLSPQWFSLEGINPDAFSSRFSPRMLEAFIENDNLSAELKGKILDRCRELFTSYPEGLKLIERYEDQISGKGQNIIDKIRYWLTDTIDGMKAKKDFTSVLPKEKSGTDEFVHFGELDFAQLLKDAEAQGKAECTNNDFYIYDSYFDTYIKPTFAELKNSYSDLSYSVSKEYDDLRLFLEVCNELNLEVMLINVPVNGFWYDYAGFPKERRAEYYQNIRDIADEYNVSLLDLSEHEYTPYFLKDIMHMGWKGWAYIDEGIYEFYKKDLSK